MLLSEHLFYLKSTENIIDFIFIVNAQNVNTEKKCAESYVPFLIDGHTGIGIRNNRKIKKIKGKLLIYKCMHNFKVCLTFNT